MLRNVFLAVAAATLTAVSAGAQNIVGRVIDRASNESIAGVVVSGLDSSRAVVVARTVTDRANGYQLPLMPGMVRLQFRRIGYAPAEVALTDSVNGRIDVTMTRLPTQLPPVKAITTAQCDNRPDREDAMALWDQARSGMLTSIVARESKSAWISALVYQHGYDGDEELPRTVQRIELASASNAFAAGSDPASLMKDGYLARGDFGQAVFLAPDDVVLFDDTFLATHCFSLVPSATDDSTIALRFEPGKGRKKPDIDGIVQFRREPLDLKSVQYRYVNIDGALQRANPGGSITFHQMPTGITMIQQWRIRGAAVAIPRSAVARGVTRRAARAGGSRDPVATATETGAIIELMQWPDAEPFLARLGTVSGVVREAQTGKLVRNKDVRLDDSPFTAKTDSSGAFKMIDVLPGTYQVDLGEATLDRFGIAPPAGNPRRVVAGANDFSDLTVEGAASLVKRACEEKDYKARVLLPPGLGSAAVFGRVVGPAGSRPDDEIVVEVRPASLVAGSPPFTLKGKLDPFGRFRICGVPIDGTVTITNQTKGLVGRETLIFERATAVDMPYQLTTVTLKPPPPP